MVAFFVDERHKDEQIVRKRGVSMQHGKQRQRRLFGIILILTLLGNVFEMPAQQVYATESGNEASGNYVASGTCGTNVTWTLDEEGVLTISGSGTTSDPRVCGTVCG